MAKLAETKPDKVGIDIFFTPKGDKPICNEACNHCYYFQNFEDGTQPIPAQDVPTIVAGLKQLGYGNVFLITSEILLAPNWKELIKASGDTYVNTNGRVIAAKKSLLEELTEVGIKQIVITANITQSHQQIGLTPKAIVEAAFKHIKAYNSSQPHPSFNTVATAIITSENYGKVPEMCAYVHDVYGANGVKFIALVPFKKEHAKLVPSLEQLLTSVGQIQEMRQKYKPEEFYIQRGGTIGTQGLSPEKIAGVCPAGVSLHAVKSLQDGSPVTPCIYIKEPIGYMEGGSVKIDKYKLSAFLGLKSSALHAGYCPAHMIGTAKFAGVKM